MLGLNSFKLTSDVKESFLLLAFALLMREHLSLATLGFVCLGTGLVVFKFRPEKKIRNILALGIFGSYWWTYGKVIDPEVGLNFLTSVTVLKLMEKENLRDRFMVFFGLILIISAGSLFEKTLSYVFFFGFSFFILIQDFYKGIGARWRVSELIKAIIWVMPLTAFLFFLAPRAMNPLAFQQGNPGPGEIGYTTNINISDVESLVGNNNPVFEVLVDKKIPSLELYWRGNSLSFTDGWNWILMHKTYPKVLSGEKSLTSTGDEIRQTFRSITREDYFFSLDHPMRIYAKERVFSMEGTKSFPNGKSDWTSRYEVVSLLEDSYPVTEDLKQYTRLPLPRKVKAWVEENFPGTTATEVSDQVEEYFRKNGFTYSLTPGKVGSFIEFMRVKKTGFCSHYASALALIFRIKKIPARLVSGFLGGSYNHYAGFYTVYQNDAHAWVEVIRDGKWSRVDPSGWVAPARLTLGGEAFMAQSKQSFNFLNRFGWYYEARLWLGQWDFVFYQWLEQMDYQHQEGWIKRFKLKRHWVYSFAIMTLVFFMLLYAWSLKREAGRDKFSFHQKLWQLFLDKIQSKGLSLRLVSLEESRKQLEVFQHKDQGKMLKIWDELVRLTFAQKDDQQGKETLREIKKL